MRPKLLWMLAGVLLCAVVISGFTLWWAMDVPPEHQRTDDAITSADMTVDESRKAREMLTKETAEKVVIIREQVRQEVRTLSPDGLVDFARNEIDIFRGGSAGGGADPSAAGLDSE